MSNALNTIASQSINVATGPIINHSRPKNSKPLSMNDSMFKKIFDPAQLKLKNIKDKKSSDLLKKHKIEINNQSSMLLKNTKVRSLGSSLISGEIPSTLKSKIPLQAKKNNITINLTGETPDSKNLKKIPSNGSNLETITCTLNSDILNQTRTDNDIHLQSKSVKNNDVNKLAEELLDYKLKNSKLKNEVSILKEKMKTLKQLVSIKDNENEMIKNNYADIMDEYKKESAKSKTLKTEHAAIKESMSKYSFHLGSTISILIELMEMFLSFRSINYGNSNYRHSINNENISATDIDVYCSYANDEDKRNNLVDQIQGLLVSKLNVMRKSLHMDLDKELERIKSWNIKTSENEFNISNLKISKNIIEESTDSFIKKNYSNDIFDLSISQQMIGGQSPKFNSANSEISSAFNKEYMEDHNKLINSNNEKATDNFLLNDSFLKDLKQSILYIKLDESFSIGDKNQSVQNISNIENQANNNDNNIKEINITDCSIIDINAENKGKEARMLFNDDPTEFNMEFNVIPCDNDFYSNYNYGTFHDGDSFSKRNDDLVILNPSSNLNLSFNNLL